MLDDKLGVCIVGCGGMGTVHAKWWAGLPEARVAAVVDVIPERAAALAESCQLDTWYTDYREALKLTEVDVVSVCVPTVTHPEVTIFAANQGQHVLCEKPIALTLADADRMIEVTRQKGVKFSLGLMRRYSPVMETLRDWLGQHQIGRPLLYYATDAREIRPKREMHNPQGNGGPVIDMGVHLFDGWAYLFDSEPVEVFAQGFKFAAGRAELAQFDEVAYDTANILVRYASGDIGSFIVSWGLPPGVNPAFRPDRIFGPAGTVELGLGPDHQEARLTKEGSDLELVVNSNRNMYRLEIVDFARCILEDRPPRNTGQQGRAALQVALAALESIQTDRPVAM